MVRWSIVALCGALTACVATVPVYRGCTEPSPQKPDKWPTDKLHKPVTLDAFTQHAIAEIELREAYELELETALANCKRN